jgi:putative FmdB family regulatory protein
VPTYQYLCTECGGQLEAVQKFTDEPLTVHDDCGGRLRKVFSPVGIVFKGSGFYRTDSRASASSGVAAPAPRAASKSAGESSSSADSSSSSKPSGESSSSSSSEGSSSGDKPAKSSGEKAAKSSGEKSAKSSGEKVA